MRRVYKSILATNDAIEYEIANMQEPISERILSYLDNDEGAPEDVKWIIQESLINLDEMEMAYQYCDGVTQVDFRSTNGIKLLIDFDDFKKESMSV